MMKILIVFCIVLGCVLFGASPVHASDSNNESPPEKETFTLGDLKVMLEPYPHIRVVRDYGGPVPTQAEAQRMLAKTLEAISLIQEMDANVPDIYSEGADVSEANDFEIKRSCSKLTGVLGHVRFEFWLDTDGSKFTKINEFETTFIPVPTLPIIGGVAVESIEGEIYNDYNYKIDDGARGGGADVEVVYTILETFDIFSYYSVLCSVKHP